MISEISDSALPSASIITLLVAAAIYILKKTLEKKIDSYFNNNSEAFKVALSTEVEKHKLELAESLERTKHELSKSVDANKYYLEFVNTINVNCIEASHNLSSKVGDAYRLVKVLNDAENINTILSDTFDALHVVILDIEDTLYKYQPFMSDVLFEEIHHYKETIKSHMHKYEIHKDVETLNLLASEAVKQRKEVIDAIKLWVEQIKQIK